MPAFQIVERAVLSPTTCATCGSVQGPFLDTLVSRPPWGRIYICLGSCLHSIAKVTGLLFPEAVEHLEDEVERLTIALEEAQAQQVVPLGEVLALVESRVPVAH